MITGPLPDCIWNLPLETLDLSNNQIHTTIPPVWNNLTSIVMMDISNNQFYGPLPIKQTFPNLVNLFLNHNQLSGPLPDDLGLHFPNLEKMSLSFNQFNGSANGIRMLTNSRVLMLDHNQFDCELHPLLNMLSSVSILDLSYNNLRGSIPMTAVRVYFWPPRSI
jgi:Leucine-rich repeat (LRR) protein